MSVVRTTGRFGLELCQSLGLDAHLVRRIELIADVNDLVRVNAELFLRVDQSGELLTLLKRYDLHEATSHPAAVDQPLEPRW